MDRGRVGVGMDRNHSGLSNAWKWGSMHARKHDDFYAPTPSFLLRVDPAHILFSVRHGRKLQPRFGPWQRHLACQGLFPRWGRMIKETSREEMSAAAARL